VKAGGFVGLSLAEALAGLAGLAAAVASIAGYPPGCSVPAGRAERRRPSAPPPSGRSPDRPLRSDGPTLEVQLGPAQAQPEGGDAGRPLHREHGPDGEQLGRRGQPPQGHLALSCPRVPARFFDERTRGGSPPLSLIRAPSASRSASSS
jgi:hypothetical protein